MARVTELPAGEDDELARSGPSAPHLFGTTRDFVEAFLSERTSEQGVAG